jgi:bifunctional pyridoxal-dependent enzyme with beta-cystathionase and maltose regulon repressor activities
LVLLFCDLLSKSRQALVRNCLEPDAVAFAKVFTSCYTIIMDFVKLTTGYYDRYDEKKRVLVEEFPKIEWCESNGAFLAWLNLVAVAVVFFALSTTIKRWRGISEE